MIMPDMCAAPLAPKTIRPNVRSRPVVSVIIPTFRRPEGLEKAIASVMAQGFAIENTIEIIVCDNSPEGSARASIDALLSRHKDLPLSYLHEPKTGVANARNRALRAHSGTFIAFLDDDEAAPMDWLESLMKTQARFDADVVFGPVKARLDIDRGQLNPYFIKFFSRTGQELDCVLPTYYGCGNSLIRATLIENWTDPFETCRNESGGEDDAFFHTLSDRGALMVWAAEAPVFEDVTAQRARLGYTLVRAYVYGQGPAKTALRKIPPDYICAAYWMGQGLVQALVMGLASLFLFGLRPAQGAEALDKASRGLGKFFWFYRIGLYGQAMLKRADKQKARRS